MTTKSKWVTFDVSGKCGYCGFDPETDEHHYCDGFGHSIESATGKVHGDGCRNCKAGRACEKASALTEENVQNIVAEENSSASN